MIWIKVQIFIIDSVAVSFIINLLLFNQLQVFSMFSYGYNHAQKLLCRNHSFSWL
jgi:hypothetical protein